MAISSIIHYTLYKYSNLSSLYLVELTCKGRHWEKTGRHSNGLNPFTCSFVVSIDEEVYRVTREPGMANNWHRVSTK